MFILIIYLNKKLKHYLLILESIYTLIFFLKEKCMGICVDTHTINIMALFLFIYLFLAIKSGFKMKIAIKKGQKIKRAQ